MDNELICNYRKCRRRLSSHAWVTSCSHIFCNEDGIREFEKAFICPACDTQLPGKFDIIKVDLNPSEQYKSMVLAGQRPEVILEVCTRAIAFWTYQVHQEIMYQEYISSKAKERTSQLEQYYEHVLEKTQSELILVKQQLDGTKKELETSKKRNGELSEKLTERSRQYQKLQSLYESLRRKFISPSFFDRQACGDRRHDKCDDPFGISAANEFLCPQSGPSGDRNMHMTNFTEAERDFVLRPSNMTPLHSRILDLGVPNPKHSGSQRNKSSHRTSL